MSSRNDFKAFSIKNGSNVPSQYDYGNRAELQDGFDARKQPDIHILNKALRQSSVISSAVADFIATQTGDDVLDDGDIDKLIAQLNKALEQKIKTEVPDASLTQKGVVQLTDIVGNSDTLAVTQKLLQETINLLLKNINNRVPNSRKVNGKELLKDINLSAVDVGAYSKTEVDYYINNRVPNTRKVNGKMLTEDIEFSAIDIGVKRSGDIYLSAHPASDLAKGEYIANGDVYAIDSNVGRVLNSLSAEYKKAWGIKQSGGKINLPNLFVNGRGAFMRAGLQPGVIQGDAIRNITGSFGWWNQGLFSHARGAFSGVGNNPPTSIQLTRFDGYSHYSYANFDVSKVVPTADENRPLNVSMIPVIYLAV
ncbi:tail fiber protein [Photorhabdus australis]|uniref:tail fiber protein n=1 Tax=Photorhabdus australis TaxID=286156 RepID=UPI0005667243|nr:tail fiber protein [Photorhabdus australis]